MADYIRREDALHAVQRQRGPNRSFAQNEMLNRVKAEIIRAPAADVAPVVRGKPITKIREVTITEYHEARGVFASDGSNVYIKNMVHAKVPYDHCPVCGAVLCSRWHNYCGKCGAKMDDDG